MPKLAGAAAKRVDAAEARHESGGDFEPLAPGQYLAQLRDVSVRDDTNKYGAAVWSAEFHNLHSIETQTKAPGRQWLNLTQPSSVTKIPSNYVNGPEKWEKYQNMLDGLLKGFFESFGYTVDSDTDEMLGEWCIITLDIRTIQQGPKEGKKRNEVTGIEALPEDFDLGEFGVEADDEEETF